MQDSHDDIAGEDHEQLIDFPQSPAKLSASRKLTSNYIKWLWLSKCFFYLFTAHLERSLKIAKDEIETYTESTISKQKDIANEVPDFRTCLS